jgi:hypothetical protein
MDILRQNLTPSFEIVPRYALDLSKQLRFLLINENTKVASQIISTVTLLDNENYKITFATFPASAVGDKISYTLIENISEKIVSLGKILVVGQTESVQNYSKILNTKFYN